MKMTKDEFNDWKESFGTKYFYDYLRRRKKEVAESLVEAFLNNATIAPEIQIANRAEFRLIDFILDLEFEQTEKIENGEIHREMPDNASMGESSSQTSGY